MSCSPARCVAALVLVVGMTAVAPRSVRAAESVLTRSFAVTIDSKMTMLIEGQEQKIEAYTVLTYTRKRSGQKVEVWFNEVLVKASNNGQELMNITMNAEKVVNVRQGETKEVKAADAPDDVKQALKDSFGSPLCEIGIDAAGAESKIRVLAGPGAKSLIDNGLIAGARLFHVNFPPQQDQWQAENEVSMGSGGYAKGKLNYEKVPGGVAGRPTVKVVGTLLNDEFKPAGSPASFKQCRYVVTGEQTYDSAQKEWVAGSLVLQVTFDLVSGEKVQGSAKGTMNIGLKSLAGQQSPVGRKIAAQGP